MKEEVALQPAKTYGQQAIQLKEFQDYFNEIRPHEALGGRTPSELYQPSTKPWKEEALGPTYPSDWLQRKVDASGQISVHGNRPFITESLKGEILGLEHCCPGVYDIYYGPIYLGQLDCAKGFKRV